MSSDVGRKPEEKYWHKNFIAILYLESDIGGPQKEPSKPPRSSKHIWHSRVRPERQPMEDNAESRHPFALYGSGEKDADIAGRKTHNVRPVASTKEVICVCL